MIWELVKRDPASKMMPYFAGISAVVWGIVAASFSEALAEMSAMMAMGLLIAYRGLNQRYTPLHATLPIAGKELFLSRVLSLMGFIWIPILAAFAATAVVGGKWMPATQLTVLALGGIITLAMMLIHCVRMERLDPPGWLSAAVFVSAVVAAPVAGGLLPIYGVAVIASVAGGCLVASAALFLKGWSEVPKCFQLAPVELQRQDLASTGAKTTQTTPWWTVCRTVYFPNWKTGGWPLIMLFMMFGSLIAGQVILSSTIYIPLSYSQYRNGLSWLLHLPISARKLAWVLWFPAAAIVILGLTINFATNGFDLTAFLSDRAAVYTDARVQGFVTRNIGVPAGYWRWARGGNVPAIEAPWGEQHRPETRGWRAFAIYNPYAVGQENSQRFLAWLFERATEAVYGKAIPISEAAALSRMKPKLHQARAQIIIAALVLLYLLIQICALHLSTWKRLPYAHRGLRLLIGIAPMVALYPGVVAPALNPEGGSYLLESTVLRLSSVLPDSLWMLGLIAGAAIAGLYWIADRLWVENEFGQIELPWNQQAVGR
jgi:hypothetical protein